MYVVFITLEQIVAIILFRWSTICSFPVKYFTYLVGSGIFRSYTRLIKTKNYLVYLFSFCIGVMGFRLEMSCFMRNMSIIMLYCVTTILKTLLFIYSRVLLLWVCQIIIRHLLSNLYFTPKWVTLITSMHCYHRQYFWQKKNMKDTLTLTQ